ncbi:alpha/beta hydrolase [Rubrobacter taiwanensis]|jgi:pimeloyl-ACP methyl ester carboxylesterase|uniref:Alpha/beta hydrolase n=1 Tax=Rubrobacter taiwanensis TaxID=185139 RepID=A0A4V2NX68_9ACTN|nr:alpha/beta hydrolase [Rubrobacter taiwanensis]TCJ20082.1 alpha/beta hydrolase [Rubrobacter taiwanensis]
MDWSAARRWLGLGDIPLRELECRYAGGGSRFAEVRGLRVHYRDEGEGPVLLMLHGVFSSLHTWEGWVERLRGRYRLVRPDVPGFGLTGPPADVVGMVRDIEGVLDEFADALGLGSFSLAGSSLGGYFAWRYALARPERVERMVLISSAGYPLRMPPLLRLASTPVFGDFFRFVSPRPLVRMSLREVYADRRRVTGELVRRYHELMLRPGNRRTLRAASSELMRQFAAHHSEIRRIATPTLVMWGEEDRWIPPHHARRFVRDLQNASLVTYPGVGHVPMEESPERTAADADAFLSGRPTRMQKSVF